MKAIVVRETGDPEVMRLEDSPDPVAGPGQVVVRMHAVGVNPVDAYMRSGRYRPGKLPYTPGGDAAGVVESVGEGVAAWAAGDRVYMGGTISGAYAEKALCRESNLHVLPERLSFAQGAAIHIPYGTAYRALFQRAHALPGETILVHGASGSVGIAAVQLARAAGMTIIGTVGSKQGRRLASEQGVHHVLDHHDADHFHQAMALTGDNGVDVIIELLANANLGADLGILARHGRVAVIGSRGTVEINPGDAMGREASILGVTLMGGSDEERKSARAALAAGFENGTLNPIVGREMPLADAPQAHHAVLEDPSYGKIVLIP